MKRIINVYTISVVLLIISAIGICQNHKIESIHIDNNNGMSNSSVNVIFQDSQGIMWFGTWDGLNRYDGHKFEQYLSKTKESTTLPHPVIRDIQEEDSLHLWITTDGGISRFNKANGESTRFLLDSPVQLHYGENTFKCTIDRKGHIVANYNTGKIYLYSKASHSFMPLHVPYIPKGDIEFLSFDANNRLWVANNKQLTCYKLEGNSLKVIKTHTIPPHTISLLRGGKGHIFVQTKEKLLHINNQGELQNTQLNFNEKILCISKSQQTIYIGTDHGCYVLENGKRTSLLKGYAVFSIYKGTQNILWAGTDGKGIYQFFENSRFIHSPKLTNIESPIRAILQEDKTVWIGSKGNGLSRYQMVNEDSMVNTHNYDLGPGRSYNAVFSLCKGIDGKLFIGTDGNGLPFIENRKLQKMIFKNPKDEKTVYSVYSILQENDSTLYVGTSGNGLLKLTIKDNLVLRINKYGLSQGRNSLESNIVYSLVNDGRYLWIGTRGGGLSRLNKVNGKINTYRNNSHENNSPICDDIITLLKDHKGRLWIGTTQGLNYIEANNDHVVFKRLKPSVHLDNANIHGIEEDIFHNIWISTSNGIIHLNPETQNAINFYYRDGLQGNEFSDGASFSGLNKNRIFFGGTNGISIISPLQMEKDVFMPKLLLYQIYVDQEKKFFPGKDIVVDNKTHTIEISFSVLDYIDNDRCDLSYSLERDGWFQNKDISWTQVGESKKIILSKLFPGHYTLHVRQSNSTHIWANQTLDIPIQVTFPLWARWWTILLYAIVIFLIIRYIFHIKKVHMEIRHEAEMEHRKLQSREDIHQAKLRFFGNVARKFTNNMTQIYADISKLKISEEGKDSLKYVNRIDANIQQMNRQIRQLADIKKAETNDTEIITEEIDLMDSIKYAFDDFSTDINNKKLNLIIANRYNIANTITDKNLLTKALHNLLSYIIANTFNDSSVEVTHHWEEACWNITYTYNGISPTEKELNIIFNRYKALENFENKLSDGKNDNVISLTVCNDLLQRINGHLKIEKICETSTSCTLVIPKLKLSEKKKEEHLVTDSLTQIINHKDKTVLIIEKDETMQRLMTDTLQLQYNILHIDNEDDAQKMFEANTIDIIIYDPANNNYDFIDQLQTNKASKNIPLIFVSTESEKDTHVDIIQRGANAIIEKPFRTDYLKAITDRTLAEMQRMLEFSETSAAYIQKYDSKEFSENDKKFLQDAIDVLKAHYEDEEYSLDKLAKDLLVSRTQLYRKLKMLINTTPNDFITNYRMQQAEKMLKSSNQTISEIITKCGFRNRAFFYREFTRKHNCSPKDFRNKKEMTT